MRLSLESHWLCRWNKYCDKLAHFANLILICKHRYGQGVVGQSLAMSLANRCQFGRMIGYTCEHMCSHVAASPRNLKSNGPVCRWKVVGKSLENLACSLPRPSQGPLRGNWTSSSIVHVWRSGVVGNPCRVVGVALESR